MKHWFKLCTKHLCIFGSRSRLVVACFSRCNCAQSGLVLLLGVGISAERSDSYRVLRHVLTKKKVNVLTVLKDSPYLSLELSIVAIRCA